MKFIVQSPVKFGGERHEIGATVEMSEKQAAPLIASGDLVEFKDKKADKKAGGGDGNA